MASHDPRRIRQALEELDDRLAQWSDAAREATLDAQAVQREADEQADQCSHVAESCATQLAEDESAVSETLATIRGCVERCGKTLENARKKQQASKRACSQAQKNLSKWKGKLRSAEQLLRRAKSELASAQRATEVASAELTSARAQLSRAQSRLAACRRDQNGKDCRSEQSAVGTAQRRVRQAQAEVRSARRRVEQARGEMQRVQVRVHKCTSAVGVSKQALSIARRSENEALTSMSEAEQAVEMAERAHQEIQRITKSVARMRQLAEFLRDSSVLVAEETNRAATLLSSGRQAELSLGDHFQSAHGEIDQKIEDLRVLDAVSNERIIASLTSRRGVRSSEGSHGYAYREARKAFMFESLNDPKVASHIKGWIRQEINRVGKSGYLRSPPGYDVGHKRPGIDLPENFHWESSDMNRSKGAKHHL